MSGIMLKTEENYLKEKHTSFKDLTNQIIGSFTILKFMGRYKGKGNPHSHWLCKCNSCGKEVIKDQGYIRTGFGCGCKLNKFRKGLDNPDTINLVGKKIGKLNVISYLKYNENIKDSFWSCICDCGKSIIKSSGFLLQAQNRNHFTSCGCARTGIENDKFKDLTGKTFNYIKVIKYVGYFKTGNQKTSRNQWLCKCLECGREFVINSQNMKYQFSCGCRITKKGSERTGWKGTKLISGQYLGSLKRGAESRDLSFSITCEFLENLFLKQNGKCALSGVPISLERYSKEGNLIKLTASVDRIDSSLGYTENNVQWVHKDINKLKQDFDEKKLVEMCKLVANNKKN